MFILFFFFFKQKTAYEMRISDWSSDVCSSDLEDPRTSVLLIEAGPNDTSPIIAMPRGIGKLLAPGNPHVWDYQVTPAGNLPPEIGRSSCRERVCQYV